MFNKTFKNNNKNRANNHQNLQTQSNINYKILPRSN